MSGAHMAVEASAAIDCDRPRAAGAAARERIRLVLWALLVLSLAGPLIGALHQEIAGDELIFLARIHRAASGGPLGLLQTPYVHFFGWLTRVEGDEIAQITMARLLYVGIWAGSLALLYRLGRHLLDPLAALAGTTLFALFICSAMAASSFRIDGLLLPVLLAVALLLLNPTNARIAAAGALSGAALALSIKAVLWAPAFAGALAVGLWDRPGWRERLRPVAAGALACGIAFGGIMAAHGWLIAGETGAEGATMPGVTVSALGRIGAYMFLEKGLFPMWEEMAALLVIESVTWLLIAGGLALTASKLREAATRRQALVLLLLASPALFLAFYANAFAYAYLILLPTTCLLAGRAFAALVGDGSLLRRCAALACLAAAAMPPALFVWDHRTDKRAEQRQILEIVHDLFPEPVPYIDGAGLVASFPWSGMFISQAVMHSYRARGTPVLARSLESTNPPLLIVTDEQLDVWDGGAAERLDPERRLLPQDEAAIRAAYAPYWGPVHLAGRQWRDLAAGESTSFDIVIAGDYTLLAEGPAIIDGRTYSPGAALSLEAGRHKLVATEHEPDLRLLWGRELPAPPPEPAGSGRAGDAGGPEQRSKRG